MTRSNGRDRASIASWKVETLRLTTFHFPDSLSDTNGWWNGITGEDPESVVSKPKTGERVEAGRTSDAPFTLRTKTREGRVDWVMGEIANVVESPESVILPDRLTVFVESMKKWLHQRCPAARRLALGVVALLRVNSIADAYSMLSSYLDFDLSPNATDFLYQINRPRTSALVQEVSINRLTKWSCIDISTHKVLITDGVATAETLNSNQYYCRLELDINSAPAEMKSLPADKLDNLLEEFAELAREIVVNGDVP